MRSVEDGMDRDVVEESPDEVEESPDEVEMSPDEVESDVPSPPIIVERIPPQKKFNNPPMKQKISKNKAKQSKTQKNLVIKSEN